MNAQINSLLAKKMDRKDFLKHVGIGLIAMTGVSAALKTLAPLGGTVTTSPSQSPATSFGYGSSSYGGNQSDR